MSSTRTDGRPLAVIPELRPVVAGREGLRRMSIAARDQHGPEAV